MIIETYPSAEQVMHSMDQSGLGLDITRIFCIGSSELFATAKSFWPGMKDDFFGCDLKFSFGDTNRTLVTADDMANEIERCLDDEEQWTDEADAWIEKVRSLGCLYIDLEN